MNKIYKIIALCGLLIAPSANILSMEQAAEQRTYPMTFRKSVSDTFQSKFNKVLIPTAGILVGFVVYMHANKNITYGCLSAAASIIAVSVGTALVYKILWNKLEKPSAKKNAAIKKIKQSLQNAKMSYQRSMIRHNQGIASARELIHNANIIDQQTIEDVDIVKKLKELATEIETVIQEDLKTLLRLLELAQERVSDDSMAEEKAQLAEVMEKCINRKILVFDVAARDLLEQFSQRLAVFEQEVVAQSGLIYRQLQEEETQRHRSSGKPMYGWNEEL